ncbi:MAG: ECF-type sigma factor [Acidobacteriota bacterium]|nr:ECF-type sigma factor [Acidobacteriota bacterium]
MTASSDEVAPLLARWRAGDKGALTDLMPVVYDDLCRLARALLRQEGEDPVLQPTALVHEIYLRLHGVHAAGWQTRTHFYRFVACLMRQVLVDHARARSRAKRGPGIRHVPLDEAVASASPDGFDRRAVNEALRALKRADPQLGRVVELRYFVGLTTAETAAACGVSPATVKRGWQSARVWLRRALDS